MLVTVDSAGPEWLGTSASSHGSCAARDSMPARTAGLCCRPGGDDEVHGRARSPEAGVGADRIYASMERNMQCGIGHCGHCQLGPTLDLPHGPVYRWSEVEPCDRMREL